MKSRRVVCVVLAVLFAGFLIAWAVAMPGEGMLLYVVGMGVFGSACGWCAVAAVRPGMILRRGEVAGQPLVVRAITSRTL